MAKAIERPNRMPEPERERWTPLRGGIQNVWEYDDRRFVFERGRLLLRGQNEAGKTKAMELLFPFLLDADLAPQRLDPFGSVARPMRWNLINDADPQAQLRIGYVWLELGRLDAGRKVYCTLGAGLKARRGSPEVDAWFFLTAQRPDRDLAFVVDGRPRAKGDLAEAIGGEGQVFDRHGDYRRAVNARLFGMPEEQYAALVETLLHLRRPHLSKSLDLDQLSAFLSASLPPLDGQVVGPIAEGFERLDQHRAELEALGETLGKVRGFEEVYREYARAVAKGRAAELVRAEGAAARARAEARERAAERDALLERREELERRTEDLERRARGLDERVRALEASDAYRAAKDLDDAEQAARRAGAAAEEAARRAAEDEVLAGAAASRREEAEREVVLRGEEAERARTLAATRAKDAALAGGHAAVEALAAKGNAEGAAGALAALRALREAVLAQLRDLARELVAAEEAHRRAEERARERADALEAARDALRGAEASLAEAEERWVAAAERWAAALRVLPRERLPEPRPGDAPADPPGFRAAVEREAEPVRRALSEERAGAMARLAAVREEGARLQTERDALAGAPHPAPPAPAWRAARPADRPGAPLFLICDFGEGAAGAEAGIEAALEASGLLDAWVEPDGTLLDPRMEDAVLRGAPAAGRTLADVLAPVAAGGVSEERARAALSRVGFAAAGEEPEGPAWVAADGRWRLGPLHGALTKEAPAWVGATARERERARRLAEMERRLAELDAAARSQEDAARSAEERLDALGRELAALPPGNEIEAERARVLSRAEAFAEAQRLSGEAERAASAAEARAAQASAALDRAAAGAGLAAWARDPDAIAERSRAYLQAAEALVASARELCRARAVRDREGQAALEAGARAERSSALSDEAAREAAGAAERGAALREVSGKERDEVLRALETARAEAREAGRGRAETERELRAAGEGVGEKRKAAEQAEAEAAAREEDRQRAARGFRALAECGLLAAAGLADGAAPGAAGAGTGAREAMPPDAGAAGAAIPEAGPPALATFTAVLERARAVDAAVAAGATAEERERAEDRLVRRASDLQLQLPPDVRILPSRAGDVLSYQFTWNGRTRPSREVVREIEAEVAARSALLGEEERRLLEAFLSGEAHEHLAARLREARAIVERMNAALEARTTAAGAQVRLAWDLDEAAQEDAREAVPLFLRAGALLSERNRTALRAFLERRLALAREADGAHTLQDRLLDVLDYRAWHRFRVEHRTPGESWARLTRKAHAAGSGGKKAVMLHLPLFAAGAAFYDSADPAAPRLIALDEAFAGIDRPTRGKLMGLLAEFDLDFVMTSFEEWGCYAELDGLSTYHLSREPGQRGVYAEWFLWNGQERVLVEES